MILCDTGIIVGAIDEDDNHHHAAIATLGNVRVRMVTTWPCLTEAMYLLGRAGINAQESFRRQIARGLFAIPPPTELDAVRACELMRQYLDTPMDFADASLVVAAERLGIQKILTFDHHFYAYRIHGKTPFEILP